MGDAGLSWLRLKRTIQLATIETRLATLQFKLKLFLASYDPNEARVPAGSPDGGQWTDGGGTRLAQTEEEDNPRRALLEETLDPTAEVRAEMFRQTRDDIAKLEPNNTRLTYVAPPDYTPTAEDVREMHRELEAVRDRVSERIANGHAFHDHAKEFGVSTAPQFRAIVRTTISDPTAQTFRVPGGNTGFYTRRNNTLVIVDYESLDGGTAYRPKRGQAYIDDLERRGAR